MTAPLPPPGRGVGGEGLAVGEDTVASSVDLGGFWRCICRPPPHPRPLSPKGSFRRGCLRRSRPIALGHAARRGRAVTTPPPPCGRRARPYRRDRASKKSSIIRSCP